MKQQVRTEGITNAHSMGVNKKKILKRRRKRRHDEKEFKLVDNIAKGSGNPTRMDSECEAFIKACGVLMIMLRYMTHQWIGAPHLRCVHIKE